MPYIKQSLRENLNPLSRNYPKNPGELNYQITRLINMYLGTKSDITYRYLNEVMGVLSCIQQELYRRVIVPYEDRKCKENGEVFNGLSRG
jgi:hypothetical protein